MADRERRDVSTDATFEERRRHLAHLSDEGLYRRFWELTEKIVEPLLQVGREYTTPAIERSILLRMGFSSIEAQAIVRGVIDHGLMERGAGHIVWKVSEELGFSIRESGLLLAEGKHWDVALRLFDEVAS
ncbi:MAG TPA: ornithine aminomutase [Clostridiaceae bacterium]|jgi:D-ornithine 4,5-aminomutase subunit alpha|nr:ornithine aminomutase [Clostridiaceae bacterium]